MDKTRRRWPKRASYADEWRWGKEEMQIGGFHSLAGWHSFDKFTSWLQRFSAPYVCVCV